MQNIPDYFFDQKNLKNGILGRLGFKTQEERALEQAYVNHKRFQDAIVDPNMSHEQILEISEELMISLRIAAAHRTKWQMAAENTQIHSKDAFSSSIFEDEAKMVTQDEIDILQAKRIELENLLSDKIKFDGLMESVRQRPSRADSAKCMIELDEALEKIMAKKTDQESCMEMQKSEIGIVLAQFKQVKEKLDLDAELRQEIRKEINELNASDKEYNSTLSSKLEEGEIKRCDTPSKI